MRKCKPLMRIYLPPLRVIEPSRAIIEPLIKGITKLHRSMIQMRVCATNEAFLPEEQICESCICAKIIDRYCIEKERCGSVTQ